jgi:hypothetical protein
MTDIWTFLRDPNSREVLSWLGSGIGVLAGGAWAIWKFAYSKKSKVLPSIPTVQASLGGVAAGRDIRDSTIKTGKK